MAICYTFFFRLLNFVSENNRNNRESSQFINSINSIKLIQSIKYPAG